MVSLQRHRFLREWPRDLVTRLKPALQLTGDVVLLVCVFVILDRWLLRAFGLPEKHYFRPCIGWETLKHWAGTGPLVLGLVLAAGALLFRRLIQPWTRLQHGRRLRWFITWTALILAWTFASYDYNLYVDQGHYADRFLLLALVVLIWCRPVFVFPYLVLLIAVSHQFHHPWGMDSETEYTLLVQVLVVFWAAFLLSALLGRPYLREGIFVVCCLVASRYWFPGLGKIHINWVTYGHVENLWVGAYVNGWLASWSPERILAGARWLARLDPVIVFLTMVLQCGALFFLWRRSCLAMFATAWIGFHLLVFIMSGIFLWKWVLLLPALLALFYFPKGSAPVPIFGRSHFLLSLLLIGGSMVWARPARMWWFDTRLYYTFQYEAVSEKGQRYFLYPGFFAPYDRAFVLGQWEFLSPEPRLVSSWGSTKRRVVADALDQPLPPEEVFALERRLGTTFHHQELGERFERFIRRFFENLNRRQIKGSWLGPLAAPPHLWTAKTNAKFLPGDPIRKVLVRHLTTFYDGASIREIRTELAREIEIP